MLMQNTEYQLNKIREYELNNIPEVVTEWLSKSHFERILNERLTKSFVGLNDSQNAKRVMEIVKHPEQNVENYKLHLISPGEDKFAVTSIRFQEADETFTAFVQVYKRSFDFCTLSKDEIQNIFKRYEMFEPTHIEFYANYGVDMDFLFQYKVTLDQVVVAGHIFSLRKNPLPVRYNEIEIVPADDMKFYEKYSDEYDFFHNQNEINRTLTRKETYETMNELMKIGCVYKVIIENEYVGIFAVQKSNILFLEGYVIIEELLFNDFRKKGYAPALQRKMIDTINANETDIIFGTIHSKNYASLDTATKCGRVKLGSFYNLELS